MKRLEGKSSKSSPPSQDCDSWTPQSSDQPSGRDGPARPPGSYSGASGGQSQEMSGPGSSSDRSTGIVVTVNISPAMSVLPCDRADNETRGLDDWLQMHCTKETNLLRMIPVSVPFVVK